MKRIMISVEIFVEIFEGRLSRSVNTKKRDESKSFVFNFVLDRVVRPVLYE